MGKPDEGRIAVRRLYGLTWHEDCTPKPGLQIVPAKCSSGVFREGRASPQRKTPHDRQMFPSARAGFEYYPLNGDAGYRKEKCLTSVRRFERRGRDLNPRCLSANTLSRRARYARRAADYAKLQTPSFMF